MVTVHYNIRRCFVTEPSAGRSVSSDAKQRLCSVRFTQQYVQMYSTIVSVDEIINIRFVRFSVSMKRWISQNRMSLFMSYREKVLVWTCTKSKIRTRLTSTFMTIRRVELEMRRERVPNRAPLKVFHSEYRYLYDTMHAIAGGEMRRVVQVGRGFGEGGLRRGRHGAQAHPHLVKNYRQTRHLCA